MLISSLRRPAAVAALGLAAVLGAACGTPQGSSSTTSTAKTSQTPGPVPTAATAAPDVNFQGCGKGLFPAPPPAPKPGQGPGDVSQDTALATVYSALQSFPLQAHQTVTCKSKLYPSSVAGQILPSGHAPLTANVWLVSVLVTPVKSGTPTPTLAPGQPPPPGAPGGPGGQPYYEVVAVAGSYPVVIFGIQSYPPGSPLPAAIAELA